MWCFIFFVLRAVILFIFLFYHFCSQRCKVWCFIFFIPSAVSPPFPHLPSTEDSNTFPSFCCLLLALRRCRKHCGELKILLLVDVVCCRFTPPPTVSTQHTWVPAPSPACLSSRAWPSPEMSGAGRVLDPSRSGRRLHRDRSRRWQVPATWWQQKVAHFCNFGSNRWWQVPCLNEDKLLNLSRCWFHLECNTVGEYRDSAVFHWQIQTREKVVTRFKMLRVCMCMRVHALFLYDS